MLDIKSLKYLKILSSICPKWPSLVLGIENIENLEVVIKL